MSSARGNVSRTRSERLGGSVSIALLARQIATLAFASRAPTEPPYFAPFMKKPFHLSALSLRRGNHVFCYGASEIRAKPGENNYLYLFDDAKVAAKREFVA